MKINHQITQITGNPAQVWGNVLVPARGTVTVKITGDTLEGITKTGLEKKESWIRIQNIDSVDILESPIYALLGLGVFLLLTGLSMVSNSFIGLILLPISVAIILFALSYKRRYLAIYSHRNGIIIFMNKHPEVYQEFATNVLLVARKLNSPVSTSVRQPQAQSS
jgi:hypothetical protein